MIAIGAGVSLLLGLVAEVVVVNHTPDDIAGLVRVAIMMPTAIFLAWWLLEPGYAHSAADMPAVHPVTAPVAGADIFERMAAIETTFDAAAVPAARGGSTHVSAAASELLRRSVRVPAHADRAAVHRAYGFPAVEREPLDGSGH
ncbi:MAG: hypothetical protein JWN72_2103 [Thermoleophilia bacterium]|nr:hypothetical protein [Thermoleophilia bacterium]